MFFCLGWFSGCACPVPTPVLPGSFVGSFLVTGALVPSGAPGEPATSCAVAICCPLADGGEACGPDVLGAAGCTVNADGGALSPQPALSFYGFLSEDLDAGVAFWEVEGGPLVDGGLSGGAFTATLASSGLVPGCGCAAGLTETTFLAQTFADGGVAPGFGSPVPGLAGWLDDRYRVDSTQSPACEPDAGPGCGLGCDVVYRLTAVPGQPQ